MTKTQFHKCNQSRDYIGSIDLNNYIANISNSSWALVTLINRIRYRLTSAYSPAEYQTGLGVHGILS